MSDNIIKVVAEDSDEKSSQQVEKELIEKNAEEQASKEESSTEPKVDPEVITAPKVDASEVVITDDQVLGHLRNRFGNSELSYDDLMKEKEIEVEVQRDLDEDVAAFQRYKEETGRGISDFMKTQRDFEKEDENELIRDYIKIQNPTFSDDDVRMKMRFELEYDEDEHDEHQQMERRLKKKELHGSAIKFFSEDKEKYKTPLESRTGFVPEAEREAYAKFKEQNEGLSSRMELEQKRKEHFTKGTNEVFSDGFKGFEFKISDDKTIMYNVENVQEVKEYQMSAMNFIGSHLDENRMLKDANAYHKQMYSAKNVESIVKWAYELGQSEEIESSSKEAKNIDMSARKKPERTVAKGLTVTAEETDGRRTENGNGLRIKI